MTCFLRVRWDIDLCTLKSLDFDHLLMHPSRILSCFDVVWQICPPCTRFEFGRWSQGNGCLPLTFLTWGHRHPSNMELISMHPSNFHLYPSSLCSFTQFSHHLGTTFSWLFVLVLKQVHPDTGISNKAMSILNSFVNDIFERVAGEASKLASYNKKSTISSREIQTAVRLILPGELAKHAVSEGTKAVTSTSSFAYMDWLVEYSSSSK